MTINCECGQKHKTSGEYPYDCLVDGEKHCPKCGYILEGTEHDVMGHNIYNGSGCQICGWKPLEEGLCQCGLPIEENSNLCKVCGY